MKKKRLTIFYISFCISVLILSICGCSSRKKDVSEKSPSPTEITNLTLTPKLTPEATPEVSPEGLRGVLPKVSPTVSSDKVKVELDVPTSTSAHVKTTTSKDSAAKKSASAYPKEAFTINPQKNETAEFNRFYYLDNKNRLNVFFWKYNTDSGVKYTSCQLYKEQKDGTIKDTEITWDSDADKVLNLVQGGGDMVSIMSQWTNEKNGDFYLIVCKWSFVSKDNPAYLYGIHPNGKLFVNIKLEDYLVMDKINPSIYACEFNIDYIGQDDGVAYFDYKDNSQRAVIYYDMNKDCVTRQVFTGYSVKGIINDQYVGVNEQHVIIGSIPKGKKTTNANGRSIVVGQSEVQKKYDMPKYKVISVNGKYVYILTKKHYQRFNPGDANWKVLADVSEIMGNIGADLYLNDLIAKDNHAFSLLFYEDSGAGYYINGYCVE